MLRSQKGQPPPSPWELSCTLKPITKAQELSPCCAEHLDTLRSLATPPVLSDHSAAAGRPGLWLLLCSPALAFLSINTEVKGAALDLDGVSLQDFSFLGPSEHKMLPRCKPEACPAPAALGSPTGQDEQCRWLRTAFPGCSGGVQVEGCLVLISTPFFSTSSHCRPLPELRQTLRPLPSALMIAHGRLLGIDTQPWKLGPSRDCGNF